MNKNKQRIKIAEACGWTHIHSETDFNPDNARFSYLAGKHPLDSDKGNDYCYYKLEVPDYLNDLNAMHEAEKVILHDNGAEYARNLLKIVPHGDWMHTATAAQRAEAFLKTVELWEG
jgi:hypothetical protein